jgi:hypothetical protein
VHTMKCSGLRRAAELARASLPALYATIMHPWVTLEIEPLTPWTALMLKRVAAVAATDHRGRSKPMDQTGPAEHRSVSVYRTAKVQQHQQTGLSR